MRPEGQDLVLDLDGFEGPIDLLLSLAREQKVDLARISILALAEQYLTFIEHARRLRLEVAADYLVMAAWLAYLKSRLLLPVPDVDETEPSAAEMAEALQFQIRRLEGMQEAAARLGARPRLDVDMFGRGAPDGLAVVAAPAWEARLFDLLQVYADQAKRRAAPPSLTIAPTGLYSVEAAAERLRTMLGAVPEWRTLSDFLPDDPVDDLARRSALASTFAASLELAKEGTAGLRQDQPFGPILVRGRRPENGNAGDE